MGAQEFFTVAAGNTAREAFKKAVEDAQYLHGHGGYTGTIAEKTSFKLIRVPTRQDPFKYAELLVDEGNFGKYDSAGCIHLGVRGDKEGLDQYLFFGWAAS